MAGSLVTGRAMMRELVELKNRINEAIEEILTRSEAEGLSSRGGEWTPRVDLYELPDRVILRVDLPGMVPEDIQVQIEGGQVVLAGNRPEPTDLDKTAIRRLERPFGNFVRRYALPDGIDTESVNASYRHGVLEVTLRKQAQTSVHRVPVRRD